MGTLSNTRLVPDGAGLRLSGTSEGERIVFQPLQTVKVPVSVALRTQTISETQGFMKALLAPADGKILGFTMIGPEAGELMAVVQMAMQGGLPYPVLRDAILAHPTMAEGLNGLCSSA